MSNNFKNFKQVISYTRERIYCAGECNGRFNEEIEHVLIKIKELNNYDPLQDIDDEGNNPLHLVAKNGIFEFFDVLHSHKSFDKLKNTPNNKNETPLDLVKFRIYDSTLLINPLYINDIAMWVTKPYYSESFPKLEKIMIEHGCLSNFNLVDMLISKANENLEKLTSDEYLKEEAVKRIEMNKKFESFFDQNKVRSKADLLNMCLEDQYEKDQIKIQEYINGAKKQNLPMVEYLHLLISGLKELPSNEINSFDDLLKFDQSS